ncbi:MAG: hypothetical protein AAF085_04665 [Planctomycetota bacterium]
MSFEPRRRGVCGGRQTDNQEAIEREIAMEMKGFDLVKPKEVCDYGGLDEQYAEQHFKGKDRNEIDYSDESLLEDLMWMNHAAFKYYLPGFLLESVKDDYGDLTSAILMAITSQLSGPETKRIRFTKQQAQTIELWFNAIPERFGSDDLWQFMPRIEKCTSRLW